MLYLILILKCPDFKSVLFKILDISSRNSPAKQHSWFGLNQRKSCWIKVARTEFFIFVCPWGPPWWKITRKFEFFLINKPFYFARLGKNFFVFFWKLMTRFIIFFQNHSIVLILWLPPFSFFSFCFEPSWTERPSLKTLKFIDF